MKQTQRYRNWQTFRKKKLKIETQADLESTYAHSEVNTKLNMRSYVLLLLKQKILNR